MFEMKFNCPESIDSMNQTVKGRHCDSCNKDIIDFSGMSKDEISEVLNKQKGATCGIVRPKQLVNPFRSKTISQFRMAFVFVFFLGLTSSQLIAQDSLQVSPVDQSECANCFYTLKGTIFEDDSVTVQPFTKVWVELDSINGEPNRLYRVTDENGYYEFKIPSNVKAPIDLYVNAIGYETKLVKDIAFAHEGEIVEVNVYLSILEKIEMHFIGLVVPIHPVGQDGYEIGKTILDGDNIRMWD